MHRLRYLYPTGIFVYLLYTVVLLTYRFITHCYAILNKSIIQNALKLMDCIPIIGGTEIDGNLGYVALGQ